MQTKLAVFCERLIEAGWLAAVVVVPLFFNVYSSRVFEPDKLSILRSIALVMAVAWLVKALEEWLGRSSSPPAKEGSGLLNFVRLPLVIPTLIMVGVYILTTLTSVVPRVSFWGSYQRLQGTYTFLCYVVVFMLMLNTLRSRQQLERLLTIIIIASFPISLYGIIQHFQLDPLPWGGDVTARVASNMGNAIFVAAYLIMVVPVTIARFIINLRSFDTPRARPEERMAGPSQLSNAVTYVVILALQALCLAYIFAYQLFFVSDVKHVAGGVTYYLLLASSLVASLLMVLFFLFIARRKHRPPAAWTAAHVMLFAGQSLALSYFLLLIFRLNYVVLTGGAFAEFVALGGLMLLFVVSFWFTFREEAIASHLLGVLYGFILTIQVICIFFTKSRGPWLGLLVGLFVFVFILGVRRRLTWLWVGAAGAALAGILLLAVLNVPTSPLAPLRNIPYVGRLGRVFDTESGTGKVRVLIWEGVLDLIGRHEPIGLPPDDLDSLNIIRPLVGYGPESMYVAYNRYYPPDLAHYEARNASPDRSHNETFDALAMTGWIGFIAYMFLFGSLFYYGLKWLGFARDRLQRTIYVVLWILGGVSFALGTRLLEGTWRFAGVALAVGIAFGFLAYLVIHALFLSREEGEGLRISSRDQILLIALFSAIVAHFIEIHFGIAVAATRTYFWVYAALLVVVGLSLWHLPVPEPDAEAPTRPSTGSARSRRTRRRRKTRRGQPRSIAGNTLWRKVVDLVPLSILMGLIVATLGFDLIIAGTDPAATGFSIPWLLALTWLSGGAIIMFERGREASERAQGGVLIALVTYVIITLAIFIPFMLVHYSIVSHQPEVRNIDDVVTYSQLLSNTILLYYATVFVCIFLVALALITERRLPRAFGHWPSMAILIVLMASAAVLILSTNVNIVRADIHYKQGLNWDGAEQWDASIALYEESMRLAPEQDWYHLFAARAILEKARTLRGQEGGVAFEPDTMEDFLRLAPQEVAALSTDGLFNSGLVVLNRAKDLNLLNTDHSANLGRMYRMWAEASADPEDLQQRWEQAVSYYEDATTLSPHNAVLFNEWGLVYFIVGKYEEAIEKYQQSLALDAQFAQTYILLADAYTMLGDTEEAAEAYQQVLKITPRDVKPHIQLCTFLAQQGKLEEAVEHCQRAIELAPNNYQAHRNLAIIYRDLVRIEEALQEALIARELASQEEKPAWDSFIDGLEELTR
ncbi:MAG: tetratricopeptide repeat protein [Anaerolineae bacterium]|nr:tetratricopeptide repeat protein [Anaerolineae bacterium]NIN98350.1 tetratricopeptide repeat protein [Anaerolineae bacterium]NIQ81273.1 tetratricopeptide repeat protein [Anaerolineae bacterium]